MKLSTQEEYGLRCLLQMGRRADLSGDGLTISEISQLEGLSIANVGKLMRILRLGEFVESIRGQSGGYKLSKSTDEIVVGEVLAALGGRLFSDGFCDTHSGMESLCTHSVDCSIRSLWNSVQTVIDKMLNRVTLKDLMGGEQKMQNGLEEMTEELLQVSA
jgi:Rrf2 family protein